MVSPPAPTTATGADLRDEDEVALGVGRHRVRAGRLRDGLDQNTGPVDHAEHCCLVRSIERTGGRCFAIPVGARVVAPVALVEPDFIRADDAVDVGEMLGRRVDDQRAGVGRIVGEVQPGADVMLRRSINPSHEKGEKEREKEDKVKMKKKERERGRKKEKGKNRRREREEKR